MKRLILMLLALMLSCSCALAQPEELQVTSYRSVLAYVEAERPMTLELGKTRFSLKQLAAIRAEMPADARFCFEKDICKTTFTQDTVVLDLNGSSSGITAEDLEYLIQLMPKLEKLIFSRHRSLRNKVVIPLIEAYPDIEFVWNISIASKYSVNSDATAFSTQKSISDGKPQLESDELEVLQYVPGLRALDLGHQKLTSLDFLKHVPKLRILILADNDITDITPIAQLTELQYLELFRNKVSDLTPLSGLTGLIDLNLCFMPLENTDLGVLDGLDKLERFWCNMSDVPEDMQQRFRQAHPNVQVMFDGTRSTDDGWREHTRYDQYRAMFKQYTWAPFE